MLNWSEKQIQFKDHRLYNNLSIKKKIIHKRYVKSIIQISKGYLRLKEWTEKYCWNIDEI